MGLFGAPNIEPLLVPDERLGSVGQQICQERQVACPPPNVHVIPCPLLLIHLVLRNYFRVSSQILRTLPFNKALTLELVVGIAMVFLRLVYRLLCIKLRKNDC